jgi:hypothetical protein
LRKAHIVCTTRILRPLASVADCDRRAAEHWLTPNSHSITNSTAHPGHRVVEVNKRESRHRSMAEGYILVSSRDLVLLQVKKLQRR